jgi:hypothetical protein
MKLSKEDLESVRIKINDQIHWQKRKQIWNEVNIETSNKISEQVWHPAWKQVWAQLAYKYMVSNNESNQKLL